MKRIFFSSTSSKRVRIARLIALGICLILIWLAWGMIFPGRSLLSPWGRPNAAVHAPPVPVRAEEAVAGDFPIYFSSLGTVTALNTVTVRTRVDGELLRLHFREGQRINEGDLLAEIDPRPFRAQLEQAQGQMLRDQALLRNARQNFARSKALMRQNSTTAQDVDNTEALVREYEGAVKLDQGQIDAAALQLEFTSITAPVGGRLGLRSVDAGNMVHATDSAGLVVITQVQPINVVFTVTDAQLPAVLDAMEAGPHLLTEAWDRTRQELLATGTLASLDNLIDTTTGTVRIKAEFANANGRLFPNQFVNARLRVGVRHDACIVPSAAVQLGNQGTFVYAVGPDSRVALRPVRTGPADDSRTVILQGVGPGDLVVTEGLDLLGDKTLVSVVSFLPGSPGKAVAPQGNATAPAQGRVAPASPHAAPKSGEAGKQ